MLLCTVLASVLLFELSLAAFPNYTTNGELFQVAYIDKYYRVYVGGRNEILYLDSDLEYQGTYYFDSTSNDSDEIKILEINRDENELFVCGTANHGLCSIHSLTRVDSVITMPAENPLNLLGNKISVVAFFGTNCKVDRPGSVLYTAVTYDKQEITLARRTLAMLAAVKFTNGTSNLELCYADDIQSTSKTISQRYINTFIARYIFGFEHDDFHYYIAIQNNSVNGAEAKMQSSRLIRICKSNYFSYVEVEFDCRIGQNNIFNLATAANLMIDESGRASLYVTFGKGDNPSAFEADPRRGSVMCEFKMADVRQKFVDAQAQCGKGLGILLPWFTDDRQKCHYFVPVSIIEIL